MNSTDTAEIKLTEKMIKAGEGVLKNSGIGGHDMTYDDEELLISEIFIAMIDASEVPLRIFELPPHIHRIFCRLNRDHPR